MTTKKDSQEEAKSSEEETSFQADEPATLFPQKGVLYTDGLGGGGDHNLERAYEIHERLQSSDPSERTAGDESLSEAGAEKKTDRDRKFDQRMKRKEK